MANVEISRESWGGEMTLELIPGDSHSSSSEEAGASSGVGGEMRTQKSALPSLVARGSKGPPGEAEEQVVLEASGGSEAPPFLPSDTHFGLLSTSACKIHISATSSL